MNGQRISLLLLVLSFATFCGFFILSGKAYPQQDEKAPKPSDGVSIVEILARPENFDDKLVLTQGFIGREHRERAWGLYIDREAYENGVSKNGFWIPDGEVRENRFEKEIDPSGGYVWVSGYLDLDAGAGRALFVGNLRAVRIGPVLRRRID